MNSLHSWLPVVLWMGLIFVFSSRESVTVDERFIINFLFFKTLHILEYAILYVLCFRATRNARASFLLTIAYAVSDELHQTLVPTREGRVRDVIIDGVGAAISWIFLTRLLPKAPAKLRQWGRRLEIS
ncbi:VanZ family protein [Candidatus Gottesmanbacteria bacterium]|nr:VanZ family protein [Candidatus Gottesmanbacteria bacterium]